MRYALILLALFAVGCGPTGSDPGGRVAHSGGVLTERHVTKAAIPGTKQSGLSCVEHGSSDCAEGVCVHHAGAAQYSCSRSCVGDADCPVRWRCVALPLGPGNGLCVPPLDWVHSIAEARVTR